MVEKQSATWGFVQRALREADEKIELRHAEDALRRSEAYLTEAQKLSHTGSFGWDVSGGAIYWYRESFRIFGYEPAAKATIEQVVQRVHPEDRSTVQKLIDRVSLETNSFDFEHRLLMPDGSVKHIHVMGNAIENQTGKREFVGAVSDVTAERAAEERIRQHERELWQIVDTIAQLVVFLGSDGRAIYANKFTLEYTGLSLEEVTAEGSRERIFRPDDIERVREERRKALLRGIPFENEQRARRKDGEYRWFFIRYNALRRVGRFELAEGGTIFLDEVGELPLHTQDRQVSLQDFRLLEVECVPHWVIRRKIL